MQAFTFTTVPDIHCALGAVERLPELVQRFDAQRVLIVTDQGILDAGLLAPVQVLLEEAGLAVTVFAGVVADPPEEIVYDAVALAKQASAQVVALVWVVGVRLMWLSWWRYWLTRNVLRHSLTCMVSTRLLVGCFLPFMCLRPLVRVPRQHRLPLSRREKPLKWGWFPGS